MATIPEELIERIGGTTGAGIGIAAILLAPRVARPLGRSLRALAKSAIKGYLIVSDRARTAVNEAADEWLHVYQEARSEADGEAASRNGRLVEEAPAARDSTHRPLPPVARDAEDAESARRGTTKKRSSPRASASSAPRAKRAVDLPRTERVNLNEADREALVGLPGVGERTAEKILQYRAEHGRIGSLEELREAAILFAATVERLRGLVTV